MARKEADWDNHYLEFFRNAIITAPREIKESSPSKEEIEVEAKRLLKDIKSVSKQAQNLLVSCWHRNEIESEAIWRLYCPPTVPGIAIRTTAGQLWNACSHEHNATVGRVHYVDFRQSFASVQSERIFQKRASLSHEKEVRIVLKNNQENPVDGKILKCDLESLISAVVISPFAPSWLLEVVSSAIEKFGYSFEIKSSELLEQPFY